MQKFRLLFALVAFMALGTDAFAQYQDPDYGVEYYVIEGTKMGENEGAEAACDGDVNTKLGTTAYPNYIVIEASESVSLIGYSITTANDNASYPGRNPKNWKVQGSNDLKTWVTIDEVVNDNTMQNENYTEYQFTCPASANFDYVRFYVEASHGGGFMQYSEFHPFGVPAEYGHEWVKGETIAPDCVHDGYTIYTCSDCNGYKHDDIVPATGNHTFGDDGLCTVCGASNDAPNIVNGYMQITNVKDFLYFIDRINNGYDYNAQLTADIDMTGVEFTPIGMGSPKGFTGKFDGQKHTITGLAYNNANQALVGLFSFATGADIRNVIIKKANLVGNENVGGVIGRAFGCTIDNIAVLNSYLEGRDHVAAIAGDMNVLVDEEGNATGTTITNTVSDSEIYSRSYQAGGVVGVANAGLLEHNVFTGVVQCAGASNACGLVSLIDADTYPSIIQNNVTLASHLWGSGNNRIVNTANRSCTLDENYALATMNVASASGSGASFREGNDPTSDQGCDVSIEDARTKAFYEGLGFDFSSAWTFIAGTEGKCYPVLAMMSTPVDTRIFDLPESAKLIWNNGDEALDVSGIHGSWGQPLSFEVTTETNKVCYIEEEGLIYIGDENGAYQGTGNPTIKVSIDPEVASNYTFSGNDEFSIYVARKDDVIEIADVEGMQLMLRNMEGNYILTKDIDMEGINYPGIGTSDNPFMGVFDGNGHVISNLTVNAPERNQVGFFNYTQGATIKNVGVNGIDIISATSGSYGSQVGSLIGECVTTTIENVAINGKVTARDHVGGFIGRTSGITSIKNCYSSVNVTGFSQVGGITGTTGQKDDTDDVTFENVYFAGHLHITSRGWAGGMIGLIDKQGTNIDMHGCVSIGDLTSQRAEGMDVNAVSPFIGGNGAYSGYVDGDGNVNNEFGYAVITFYDNVQNSDAIVQGDDTYRWPIYGLTRDGGDVEDPQSVPVGELKKADVYKRIGWDFDKVWTIGADAGWDFPTLQALPTFKTVDGIEIVTATPVVNDAIYNIAGQKVSESYKGIVIRNGGKYLVK